MNGRIQFLNHASYLYEGERFFFVCDPWLEGSAFNNGWKLVDASSSNDDLLARLEARRLPVFLWYSHEHADHFAVPFVRKLAERGLDVQVVFQQTHDQRLVSFLRKQNIGTAVVADGETFRLPGNSWIRIWSWRSGDSFALMSFDGFTVLNLNDCLIRDAAEADRVRAAIEGSLTGNLDLLFTQFGYAGWSGNESDTAQWRATADDKLKKVALQIQALEPVNVVLFASFAYFSHPENFYLNDAQNTPASVRESEHLRQWQDRIAFLGVSDSFDLDGKVPQALQALSSNAERRWQTLFEGIRPDDVKAWEQASLEEVRSEFENFRKKVFRSFFWLFSVVERTGPLKPLRVLLADTRQVVTLSYARPFSVDENVDDWDITMSGRCLCYSLKQDFGFDTVHINGRFRTRQAGGGRKVLYFAGPQNLLKGGFGIRRPVATLRELARLASRKG